MHKKILVLGATGAMAVYLIPILLEKGYSVVGVSLEDMKSDCKNLTYIKADAKDLTFLKEQLKEKFDAIVDFMIYKSVEIFEEYYKLFLENTKHYMFFSSYRVYAEDAPLRETSKRLLDVEKPADFVSEREYSIYKAEQEDLLNNSPYKNYTIVRPAITYSKRRLQLTILEADVLIHRMLAGKTVVLPEGAMEKYATMSWAGDVAKMLAGILFNEAAFGETYTVATAEHMKWKDIAKIYQKIGGLQYITVANDVFLDIMGGNVLYKQQLLYDRCFDRIIDNSKILSLCNMKQEDLMPIEEGLKREFENVTSYNMPYHEAINTRMDAYLASNAKES